MAEVLTGAGDLAPFLWRMNMFELFKITLMLAGTFFTLYGLVLFVLAIRPGKPPIDKSNVWNRLIAPFYVARHPEVFGGIEFWKNDVGDNMRLVQQAVFRDLEIGKINLINIQNQILSTTLFGKPSSPAQLLSTGRSLHCIFKGSDLVMRQWVAWGLQLGEGVTENDLKTFWETL